MKYILLLFVCVNFTVLTSKAAHTPMTISTILYQLVPFQGMLDPIEALVKKEYHKDITAEIYQAYTTIELRWRESEEGQLYATCTFKVEADGEIILEEVFCENVTTRHNIEQYVNQYMKTHKLRWTNESPVVQSELFYSSQLLSLTYADEIAKEAYLCDHNYQPGYYSEVYVKEDRIELIQANRKNSRSIDHKDNYYLRDVMFVLPLKDTTLPETHYEYIIGNLYIKFNDNSSPQNKACGDRMKEKIRELSQQ